MLTMSVVDPARSDTFEEVAQGKFEINYLDGSSSQGDYFQDNFEIAETTVQNLTMGLGLQTDVTHGVVGVGYAIIVNSVVTLGTTYPNLPIAMQEAGLINSVAYSLWLNDLGANTGNVLFGGIDTSKYIGSLTRIDVLRDEAGDYSHFRVPLSSLVATSPSGSDVLNSPNGSVEVILDSGSTVSYLPDDMVYQVWREVGAVYNEILEMAVLPCSYASHPGHFAFRFAGPNGPQINVTMDELVVDLTDGNQPMFTSGPYKGKLVCEFGIQNLTGGPFILGDTFLRSAYVVYDLENNEVGIAATDFNATDSNIVAFESKGAPIPFAITATDHDAPMEEPVVRNIIDELRAAEGFQSSALLLKAFSVPGLLALGVISVTIILV